MDDIKFSERLRVLAAFNETTTMNLDREEMHLLIKVFEEREVVQRGIEVIEAREAALAHMTDRLDREIRWWMLVVGAVGAASCAVSIWTAAMSALTGQ